MKSAQTRKISGAQKLGTWRLAVWNQGLAVPAARKHEKWRLFMKNPYFTHPCIAWRQFITVRQIKAETQKLGLFHMSHLAALEARQAVF